MLFSKKLVGNSHSAKLQWDDITTQREMYNNHTRQQNVSAGLHVNDGLIPKDIYQEFDRVAVEIMHSDDGDTFLNDLMPRSKPVSMGTLVSRFRQTSDAGNAQTSMTGQTGVILDQTENTYDGSIVPIHDAGFTRNFREKAAMTSAGIDLLIDDARETNRTVRKQYANSFLDGNRDKSGNIIEVDGLKWEGMRADSRVAQIDLGAGGINFDFTDQAQTGEDNKKAFIQLRDVMYIDNLCETDLGYYVSREIMSNWERKFSAQYDAKLISQELSQLMGVAFIKVSSKLVGNEIMAFNDRVRPIVGMGINTIAIPRPLYNSNYSFITWGACGWEVRTDYNSNTCAMFAQA